MTDESTAPMTRWQLVQWTEEQFAEIDAALERELDELGGRDHAAMMALPPEAFMACQVAKLRAAKAKEQVVAEAMQRGAVASH